MRKAFNLKKYLSVKETFTPFVVKIIYHVFH